MFSKYSLTLYNTKKLFQTDWIALMVLKKKKSNLEVYELRILKEASEKGYYNSKL